MAIHSACVPVCSIYRRSRLAILNGAFNCPRCPTTFICIVLAFLTVEIKRLSGATATATIFDFVAAKDFTIVTNTVRIRCTGNINSSHRIIPAIRKHVIAQQALAGGDEGVGIDEAADSGVVITGL